MQLRTHVCMAKVRQIHIEYGHPYIQRQIGGPLRRHTAQVATSAKHHRSERQCTCSTLNTVDPTLHCGIGPIKQLTQLPRRSTAV